MKSLKFENKFLVFYILIGGIWIKFSDKLLEYFISDAHLITKIQTFKGWFYVLFTAALFYVIIKNHLIKVRKAEQEAQKSDRLKSAFLQNISHEIRTPMNGIVGFSDLLYNSKHLQKEEKPFIDIIKSSSNQLLTIVNDVLDISKIESGNMKVNRNVLNLNSFIDKVILGFKIDMKDGVELIVEKGFLNDDANIISDKAKMQQILNNLISNAIKFTKQGYIKLSYELKNDSLVFKVVDTGIGIDSHLHEVIFDRFHKEAEGDTLVNDGVGLGLPICKGNVKLLGGKIWLESEPGMGSEFYFSIPYIKG